MPLTGDLPRLTFWLTRHKGATPGEVAAFLATCNRADLVDLDNRMRNIRADLRAHLRQQDRADAAALAHNLAEGVRRRLTRGRPTLDAPVGHGQALDDVADLDAVAGHSPAPPASAAADATT